MGAFCHTPFTPCAPPLYWTFPRPLHSLVPSLRPFPRYRSSVAPLPYAPLIHSSISYAPNPVLNNIHSPNHCTLSFTHPFSLPSQSVRSPSVTISGLRINRFRTTSLRPPFYTPIDTQSLCVSEIYLSNLSNSMKHPAFERAPFRSLETTLPMGGTYSLALACPLAIHPLTLHPLPLCVTPQRT